MLSFFNQEIFGMTSKRSLSSSETKKQSKVGTSPEGGQSNSNPVLALRSTGRNVLRNFEGLPLLLPNLEFFLFFGMMCCVDTLLSILCLPLKLLFMFWKLERKDLYTVILVAAGMSAFLLPGESNLYSYLYHMVRISSMLKLYVIFNILEITAYLLSSLGGDCAEALEIAGSLTASSSSRCSAAGSIPGASSTTNVSSSTCTSGVAAPIRGKANSNISGVGDPQQQQQQQQHSTSGFSLDPSPSSVPQPSSSSIFETRSAPAAGHSHLGSSPGDFFPSGSFVKGNAPITSTGGTTPPRNVYGGSTSPNPPISGTSSFTSASGERPMAPKHPRFSFFLLVAGCLITMAHSLILLLQVVTINVAINSDQNALFAILVSASVIEVKSQVYKRHNVESMMQIAMGDVVERTIYFVFMMVMLISHFQSEGFGTLEPYEVILVFGCEMGVDFVKHYFVCRFNRIPLPVYRSYAHVLMCDVIQQKFGSSYNIFLQETRRVAAVKQQQQQQQQQQADHHAGCATHPTTAADIGGGGGGGSFSYTVATGLSNDSFSRRQQHPFPSTSNTPCFSSAVGGGGLYGGISGAGTGAISASANNPLTESPRTVTQQQQRVGGVGTMMTGLPPLGTSAPSSSSQQQQQQQHQRLASSQEGNNNNVLKLDGGEYVHLHVGEQVEGNRIASTSSSAAATATTTAPTFSSPSPTCISQEIEVNPNLYVDATEPFFVPNPARRVGFVPFPYVALILWTALPTVQFLAVERPFALPLVALCVVAAKVLVSTLIGGMAIRYLCKRRLVKITLSKTEEIPVVAPTSHRHTAAATEKKKERKRKNKKNISSNNNENEDSESKNDLLDSPPDESKKENEKERNPKKEKKTHHHHRTTSPTGATPPPTAPPLSSTPTSSSISTCSSTTSSQLGDGDDVMIVNDDDHDAGAIAASKNNYNNTSKSSSSSSSSSSSTKRKKKKKTKKRKKNTISGNGGSDMQASSTNSCSSESADDKEDEDTEEVKNGDEEGRLWMSAREEKQKRTVAMQQTTITKSVVVVADPAVESLMKITRYDQLKKR